MLLGYPGVTQTVAEAKPADTYSEVLAIAQRITKNNTPGGYCECVADRAFEYMALLRRQAA
jgi:hypothetical protein